MLKILCTAEFDKEYMSALSEFAEVRQRGFSVNQDFREMLSKEELISELEDTDIFIVGYDKVTNDIIKASPDLKLILSVRDGPEENIDVRTCTELGIPVLFSAGRCQHVVPEHTMMMILASARPLIWANHALYSGLWSKEMEAGNPDQYFSFYKHIDQSREIYGKTLGLVGAGRNGIGLAKLAHAFGMEVIAYDPYADKEKLREQNITLTDLMTVMSSADYVCMMARVSPETTRMIGAKELNAMKPDSCFINTGRAALVDTHALLEILRTGRIRAAIDVYDEEPISHNNPFLQLDPNRVLLTPHFAGCSVERITFQSRGVVENIRNFLKGLRNNHIYDQHVFDSPEFPSHGGILWNTK
ncbi:MAG TPA: D-3-phosphoglycerate dehydrogenase [Candidatus Mediterraneibacter merdipullorum]|nr:D-3-phosphoglycerate dehydrogenase [Candidatus Mediterraneibacter merdipullorum]